jgi:hypothetical protein
MNDNRMRHRHLTEQSTPMEVAATNDKLREVRLAWRLAEAWEQGYHAAEAPLAPRDSEWQEDNPYVAAYRQAEEEYLRWRGGAG